MIILNNLENKYGHAESRVYLLSRVEKDFESLSKSFLSFGMSCVKYSLTEPQVSSDKSMLLIDSKLAKNIELAIFDKDIAPFHYVFSYSSQQQEEIETLQTFATVGHLNLPVDDIDINMMQQICGQKRFYEDTIKDLDDKTRALEKISSLGQFTGSIIHDLNNYNTICMTALDSLRLLNKKKYNDEKIEFLTSRGLKGCKMINSISSKYRRFMFVSENTEKEFLSLSSLVSEVMSFCEHDLKVNKITWKVEIPKGIKILCSETSMIQILINLISNSIFAIKKMENSWISIKGKIKQAGITLYIIDSGKGIDKEIQGKIFEPLFSTKDSSEGTGFGLSFCRDELGRMGISLSYVESENTVFSLDIPTGLIKLES